MKPHIYRSDRLLLPGASGCTQNPAGAHIADAEIQISTAQPVHIVNLRLSSP